MMKGLYLEYADQAADYGFKEWHKPGCSEFCSMMFETYMGASSELEAGTEKYTAENLQYDKGKGTAWAEGVEGYGIGESIHLWQVFVTPDKTGVPYLHDPEDEREPYIVDNTYPYVEICVVNGYTKNQRVWKENSRVKRLFMQVGGKPFAYLELEDTMLPQYFTLPERAIVAESEDMLDCEFIIEEVYPGTKYEDTCLTGLVMEFNGRDAH